MQRRCYKVGCYLKLSKMPGDEIPQPWPSQKAFSEGNLCKESWEYEEERPIGPCLCFQDKIPGFLAAVWHTWATKIRLILSYGL